LEEMLDRVVRGGFRGAEVPILFQDRKRGASKISQREIYRAAWNVLITGIGRLRKRAVRGAGD
ncbi:MAG: polyprenol monophosphomannose synthase, partial [Myxococcota bacterium]